MSRRYVAELRSLVDLYSHPLLHPLLSSSPSPHTSPNLSLSPTMLSPSRQPSASPSPDLPIASRFSRSTLRLSSPTPEDENDSSEISHGPNASGPLSLTPTPSLPTGARQNASHTSLDVPGAGNFSNRVASFGSRTRHPLRPEPSSTKLHKSASKAPPEVLQPPSLPDALKRVLEATVEMLKGHEELSARLCVLSLDRGRDGPADHRDSTGRSNGRGHFRSSGKQLPQQVTVAEDLTALVHLHTAVWPRYGVIRSVRSVSSTKRD